METPSLEERVERLERIVNQLQNTISDEPGRDDWKSTVGMFAGDPYAKEIIDEALKIREEERRQARQ